MMLKTPLILQQKKLPSDLLTCMYVPVYKRGYIV